MRRILLTALAAACGALLMAGTAAANVGDIESVEIDDALTGTAEQVEVSGSVSCAVSIEYGVIVKVTQPPELATLGELSGSPDTATGEQGDATAEGAGAFGPNFEGIQDDNPCGTDDTDYEVVVQLNEGSEEDFSDGDMGVELQVGTSANNGARGPGPIVGDLEFVFEVVDFTTEGATPTQ